MRAVNRDEVFHYLGMKAEDADQMLTDEADSCILELESAVCPSLAERRLPLIVEAEGIWVGGVFFPGRELARHLAGCREAILFAATLGLEADYHIRRAMGKAMSRAVILQAAAAAMIESFADGWEAEKAAELSRDKLYLRPRYSPGYGDFPLFCQTDLLTLTNAERQLGLKLTDSCLLMPSKSITAVIGLTRDQQSCHVHKCEACPAKECLFRKTS